MELLPSRKGQVFHYLKECGWDPAEFKWERRFEPAEHGMGDGEPVSVLVHKPTGFYFQFLVHADQEGDWASARYSPGPTFLHHDPRLSGTWNLFLDSVFRDWLVYMKRELASGDPWGELADKLRAMPPLGADPKSENDSFTDDQSAWLREKLDRLHAEMKAEMKETRDLGADMAEKMATEFAYLRDAINRLGRFDWRRAALGSLVDLAVTTQAPGVLRLVLHFASNVLGVDGGAVPPPLPSGDYV